MAFVIPIVAAFSTISAAGSVAAAVSTLSGFLSVAGGVLAGVGAITGKKDLVKIGGLLSLSSAASSALGASGEAAAAAGEGAASSIEAADAMRAAEHGVGNLTSATAAPTIGTLGAQTATAQPFMTPDALAADTLGTGASAADQAPSLMQRATEVAGQAPQPSIAQTLTGQPAAAQALDPVSQAGAGMDSETMRSILGSAWDKTKTLAGGVGDFVRGNKELVQIGAGALQGMYGPEAEQLDLQRSIMARRLRNLNSPVRLTAAAGGG